MQKDFLNNKIKPLLIIVTNDPFLFSLVALVCVFFISFVLCHPYYQTIDDLLIKSIADGSYAGTNQPSEFLLFTNIYYGKILKYLYSCCISIDWYDISHYFFLSISMFVINLCLFRKDSNILYKIASFLLTVSVFSLLFVSLQFTMVCATLAITAVILAIYYLTEDNLSLPKKSLIILGIFLFSIASSLIRIEAFASIILLGGLFFLSFIRKNNFKKAIFIIIIMSITVTATLGLYIKSNKIINSNNEYKTELEYNLTRLDTTEKTIASVGLDPDRMWKPAEKTVPAFEKKMKEIGWSIGTYRASLNSLHIGDVNLYNIEKYKKFANVFSDEIKIKNNFKVKFDIADYYNFFKYYVATLLILILIFPSKKNFKMALFLGIIFFAYVVSLSAAYKTLPPRVWINFVDLLLLTFMLYLKNSDFIKYNSFSFTFKPHDSFTEKQKGIMVFVIYAILFSLFMSYGFRPVSKTNKDLNSDLYKSKKSIEESLPLLDKGKVYLLDIATLEPFARPFEKNIFNSGYKILNFSYISQFGVHKQKMKNFGIPLTDTWNYICSNDNVLYLSVKETAYTNFYANSNKIAISRFLKDNYNKDVAFVPVQNTDFSDLRAFQCVTLTNEEIKRKKELRKEKYFNEVYYIEMKDKEAIEDETKD